MYLKFIRVIILSGCIGIYAVDGLTELQNHVKSSFKIGLQNSLVKECFGTENESFTDGALFEGIYQLIRGYGVTKKSLTEFNAEKLCEKYKTPNLVKGIVTTDGAILTGIFFDKNKKYCENSNTINGYKNLRLDIEGDAQDGSYVNIQLQYGVGLKRGGALASVNVRKGHYIDAAHLLFCLLQSADESKGKSTVTTINSDDERFGKEVKKDVNKTVSAKNSNDQRFDKKDKKRRYGE